MAASLRISRRQLLLALGALVLAVVVVVAVVALRSDADPVAGATTSAGPTASSGRVTEPSPGEDEPGKHDGGEDDRGEDAPADAEPSQDDPADKPDPGDEEAAAPEARETLDAAPFGTTATPEPGVTVTVTSVEKVTGEANVPGEVGGPALRFAVVLTNGTGEVLDLRTVIVNAYYGKDRTPATPLLKPGGKAFEAEVAADESARAAFVFNIPPEFQDEVELEIDPGVGSPIIIFVGS
ncbi:hypothetical protein [Promicromonospora soli]